MPSQELKCPTCDGTGRVTDLRPCPFCGETPDHIGVKIDEEGTGVMVFCDCGVGVGMGRQIETQTPTLAQIEELAKELVAAWNRRAGEEETK